LADGKVYALDADHGGQRWEFFTGGPVRFAPAVWRDRVLVASDDGYLYCLAGDDGRLIWKQRGGPRPDMLLGNDRMVSRWPARGGPVVADDLVYFAAGIWPSEGVYVYALDAASGRVVWCNDSSGTLELDQPQPATAADAGR
jgi:outer membrane protein assembly factor BamB